MKTPVQTSEQISQVTLAAVRSAAIASPPSSAANAEPSAGLPQLQDPVALELLEIIDLFSSELRAVPFPDTSHSALQSAADAVRAADARVVAATAALTAARDEASAADALLRQAARRGLAYAAIYAAASDDRAALADRVAALDLRTRGTACTPALASATAPSKRRGRKALVTAATLFPSGQNCQEQTTECTREPGD